MKLHSKFTKYLVENYPLFFHSKFFQLLGVGILMWILSYLIGYVSVTNEVLRNESIDGYYFDSYFMLFHIIGCIVVLSLWAIHFYKMKPVRNYYPLPRMYFTKLFIHLFIPFFLIVSAYVPFNEGAILRTKHLLPKEDFVKDKEKINLAFPFLVTSESDYNFSNKAYPAPFPLDFLTINEYDNGTEEDYNYFGKFYDSSFLDRDYVSQEEIEASRKLYFQLKDNDSAFSIGGKSYFFYKEKLIYTSKDSCSSNWIITEFIQLDSSITADIEEGSLLNFSRAFLENNKHSSGSYYRSWDYEPYRDEKYYDKKFTKLGLPVIHQIVNNFDYKRIEELIIEFMELSNKYKVPHYIDPELVVTYLKKKKLTGIDLNVVSTYKKIYPDYHDSDDEAYVEELVNGEIQTKKVRVYTEFEKEIMDELMYFEQRDFQRLNINYSYAQYFDDYGRTWYVFLIMAFLFVSFVVWFEFMEVKPFLLSIPVGGVLSILIFLIMMLLNTPYGLDRNTNEGILFVILFGIFVSGVLVTFSKKTNRFIASIMMNINYVLAHFLIFAFLLMINDVSRTELYETSNCGGWHVYELMPWINHPFFFLLFGIFSMFIFYLLIPIWKAKKK